MSSGLLDLIRAEQERRKAQGPADYILFRPLGMTDEDVASEIEAQRRAGRIGPHTRITEMPWAGPPLHKRLV